MLHRSLDSTLNRARVSTIARASTIDHLALAIATASVTPIAAAILLLGVPGWDTPGHQLAATRYATSIWPALAGFDTHLLGGYPAGQLYPPLFHWLCGALARLTGIEAALRILVALSLLALPTALARWLRALSRDRRFHALGLLLSMLSLSSFVVHGSIGGNLWGLVRGGLLPASFAMVLFVLYLAELEHADEHQHPRVHGALLLGLLFISHAFFSLFALAIALPRAKPTRAWLAHFAIAATLSAPWWWPALLMRDAGSGRYTEGPSALIPAGEHPLVLAASLTALVFAVALVLIKRPLPGASGLRKTLLALLAAYFIIKELAAGGILDHTPLHPYRFLAAIQLVLAVVLASRLALASHRARAISFALAGALLTYASVALTREAIARAPRRLTAHARAIDPRARGLIVHTRNDTTVDRYGSPHRLAAELAASGYQLLNGLFQESSPLCSAVQAAADGIAGEVLALPMPCRRIEPTTPELTARRLEALGVAWFANRYPIAPELEALLPIREVKALAVDHDGRTMRYAVYELDHRRAELLAVPPVAIDSRAPFAIIFEDWWRAVELDAPLPIFAPARALASASVNGPGELSFHEDEPGRFVVYVDAPEPRWVLVKIAWTPRFVARGESGAVPIYRAASGFIVLAAKGRVVIDHQ